jgi:L-lactate dehydrogenase (cytochrome)
VAGADLLLAAQQAGYEVLILTVDVPVAGPRRAMPATVSDSAEAEGEDGTERGRSSGMVFNLLTTEPLRFASLSSWSATIAELIDLLFDPTMTIDDLEWLRSSWDGPLVVKGIQNVEDARRVVAAGADGVGVSIHGGRQLDRAPIPLRVLPDVVEAVGSQAEVWVDTGIMTGADVVAAIALGARIALVGRAYLYGLMAGGERGVDRAAEILSAEVRRTMQLLGARSIDELGPQHVKLP